MAAASGDVVTVETARGPVEAQRMGRAESGQSRWRIGFPWGAETFFGDSDALAAHARKRIAEEAAEAPRSGRG